VIDRRVSIRARYGDTEVYEHLTDVRTPNDEIGTEPQTDDIHHYEPTKMGRNRQRFLPILKIAPQKSRGESEADDVCDHVLGLLEGRLGG
jgi:hypothetical protein